MSEVPARDLNRHLVYLNRKRSQFMAGHLSGSGLIGPMYSFILCLGKNPGISQDFLASFFSIDKGTVARLCKRLEVLGLLVRSSSPDDRRVYQLELTGHGQEMLLTIHRQLNVWSDKLLSGFSESDRQTAYDLLQRMADNISN